MTNEMKRFADRTTNTKPITASQVKRLIVAPTSAIPMMMPSTAPLVPNR